MLINDTAIEFFTNEMLLAKIHAEKDTVLTQKYHAYAYPTFILADSDGNEIDRIVGYAPAGEFIQIMRDYTKGIGTLEDLLAQAENKVDRELYFQIADKYKYSGRQSLALEWFQKVIDAGEPFDSVSARSRMAIGDMYRRDKDFDKAIETFEIIAKDFAGTSTAEGADFYVAYTTLKKGDTTGSISFFEEFLKKYPDSEDKEWVENKINSLKGEPEK